MRLWGQSRPAGGFWGHFALLKSKRKGEEKLSVLGNLKVSVARVRGCSASFSKIDLQGLWVLALVAEVFGI